jgi:hypothetical protein
MSTSAIFTARLTFSTSLAHQRKSPKKKKVHQRNIHGAVDIFDELRGLGNLCSTHWQHLRLGVGV